MYSLLFAIKQENIITYDTDESIRESLGLKIILVEILKLCYDPILLKLNVDFKLILYLFFIKVLYYTYITANLYMRVKIIHLRVTRWLKGNILKLKCILPWFFLIPHSHPPWKNIQIKKKKSYFFQTTH